MFKGEGATPVFEGEERDAGVRRRRARNVGRRTNGGEENKLGFANWKKGAIEEEAVYKQQRSGGNIGCKENKLFSFQPILFRFDKWLVFLLNSNCFSIAF